MKAMKAMKVISKTFLERFKNLGFITRANAATESWGGVYERLGVPPIEPLDALGRWHHRSAAESLRRTPWYSDRVR